MTQDLLGYRQEVYDKLEKDMLEAGPNATVSPAYFAASLTTTVMSLTIPLGMDYRFCRGVSVALGRSADGFLTAHIFADEESSHRPGQVMRPDPMLDIPTRTIQIPHHKIDIRGDFPMPRFTRRQPNRIFLARVGELQLTFTSVQVS